MTRSESTKKAMCTSIFSGLVCCAMLLGSTYAWFSDTANAGNNTITAGVLDVGLEYDPASTADEDWTDATDADLFAEDPDNPFLWEPGAMKLSEEFRVVNEGTLAFQYDLALNVEKEEKLEGKSLTDVIKVKVVDAEDEALKTLVANKSATLADRAEAWENFEADAADVSTYKSHGVILPKGASKTSDDQEVGTSKGKVIVLYWQPNADGVDNEYNNKNNDSGSPNPSVTFGVDVFATQTPFENDSFGINYDNITMAQHKINSAVKDGVTSANEALASSGNSEISFSELNFNASTDKYESTVTFKTKVLANIFKGYETVSQLIEDAVSAQMDNIESITIGGNKVADLESPDWINEPLGQALQAWMDEEGLEPSELASNPALLADFDCDVEITDKEGTTVVYNMAFAFDE